ncbi:hypothetical protein [Paraburkholderia hayleyella]|uniref:hypothetical protein n=1 Tax=Paraburkholderia hayleyella TaxID=2152889 RepID=UPI00129211BE|nr:hypothetical protein [Paraburkholderia hayleyella]
MRASIFPYALAAIVLLFNTAFVNTASAHGAADYQATEQSASSSATEENTDGFSFKARITGPVSVVSGDTVTYDNVTSGGEPPYKYTWSTPAFSSTAFKTSSVQLTAPDVDKPVTEKITFVAADTQMHAAIATLDVTINPRPDTGVCAGIPAWSPARIYQTYGEKVYYKGKMYKQNFYNINKDPEHHSADYGKEWLTGVPCQAGAGH